MRLQLFKSLWGVVSIDGGTKTLAQALAPLARQGYTGVECSVRLAHDLNRGGAFTALMQQHGACAAHASASRSCSKFGTGALL